MRHTTVITTAGMVVSACRLPYRASLNRGDRWRGVRNRFVNRIVDSDSRSVGRLGLGARTWMVTDRRYDVRNARCVA